MVFLKSLVSGMSVLLSFFGSCSRPQNALACSMSFDWRFFVPPAKQDHDFVAVFAKIDAIAWAEGDAPFGHALPYWLDIAQVAGLDPRKRGSYFQGCGRIELVKPIIERSFSLFRYIDNKLNHKKLW